MVEEVIEEPQVRYAPHVWLGTLFKKTVDAEAGRGGIEALCPLLDKVHWIPELTSLRMEIKTKSLAFERALMKCNKERREKLPERTRRKQAFKFLGLGCEKGCEFYTDFIMEDRLKGKCPRCGSKLEPLYDLAMDRFFDLGITPTPETLIMDVYYDRLTEAFVAGYKAWKLLLDEEARKRGWNHFRIDNPAYRNYLDEFDLGRLVGETKIPREEKQVLQFIALGPIAGIGIEEAEPLIHACMKVVKYGHISEVLGVDEASVLYGEALERKEALYNRLNAKVNSVLVELYSEVSQPSVEIEEPEPGRYPPMLLIPQEDWITGSISRHFKLKRIYKIPVFPRADFGALQTVYGPVGSGKTFLLSSLFCYAIRDKRELVFTPLGDKTNSLTLACLPMFGYSRNTINLMRMLMEDFAVEPQGVPVLTLTFLRKGEERLLNVQKNPPTKYDRIVTVENPLSFSFDFKAAFRELKAVAEEFGFNRPVGIITVRNLLEERFDRDVNVNTDVQIASNLLGQFDVWRKSDLSLPARVFVDEVATLARTKISLYARDILRSGETILSFIAESRRNMVSVDLATQMPLEILPNIRDAATNVFFRNLPMSRDKSRSQIDYLLESLQFNDPAIRTVIRDLNNRGLLGTGYWFWYHRPARDIQVVRPSPPTFCVQDPESKKSNLEIFKLYEKMSGEKILLDSWSEVKRLETAVYITSTSDFR